MTGEGEMFGNGATGGAVSAWIQQVHAEVS